MKTTKIEQTPFTVVETDQNETFITVGSHAVLQCETYDEAIEKINERDYELLFNLMFLIKNYERENQKPVEK